MKHPNDTRHLNLTVAVLAVGVLPALIGCGEDAVDPVIVSISGGYSLEVGKTMSLSATTLHGTDTSYTWSSSKTSVATVDSAGTVTAVAAGEAVISATGAQTGVAGSHPVVVLSSSAATGAVSITGGYSVKVGGTLALTATTTGTGATDSAYTWSSSRTSVAKVDAAGKVTGVDQGEVVITAVGKTSGAKGSIGLVVTYQTPHAADWLKSAHADKTAEAFTHWDSDAPPEVPTSCAKCHSTPGFQDFLGADGSAAGKVDKAAKTGTVVECVACHNTKANELASVTFPSGVTVSSLGGEARCMTCHQGRSSSDTVDAKIKSAAAATDDTVSSKLSFNNIHYYPAGATLYAGEVRGGYQYGQQASGSAKKVYDWRFRHVPSHDTCVECHDAHSLEVQVTECAKCHTGVSSKADLKKIRMIASQGQDYDGDGDLTEGIASELSGLHALLYKAIQGYAKEVSKAEICYNTSSYPYFFNDSNKDGTCSATEATSSNGFKSWTNRLVRAAYNYQMVAKDPGAYAHNAKYMIQLLYDSIADLNAAMTTNKVDLSKAVRNDKGHFNGAGEAARHWDDDAEVSASCSQCHGGSVGFRAYLKNGAGSVLAEPDNGLDCATCHDKFSGKWDLVKVESVTYPSTVTITDKTDTKSNICATCHSGRESKATIDAKITAGSYSFRNVHYLPAAAVKAGADAKVGYEYSGKTYAKAWAHKAGDACTYCHDPKLSKHSFRVSDSITKCASCHSGVKKPEEIRWSTNTTDWDGDGSATESLAKELETLTKALLATIQTAAAAGSGGAICYEASSYPYWFKDTDKDGTCSATEASYANGYKGWTPAMMKAAHNFQMSKKEPGAWAHNFKYMAQLLIDAIADLGGSVTKYTRPQ